MSCCHSREKSYIIVNSFLQTLGRCSIVKNTRSCWKGSWEWSRNPPCTTEYIWVLFVFQLISCQKVYINLEEIRKNNKNMANPWCEGRLNWDSSGNNRGGLYCGVERRVWYNYSRLFIAELTGTQWNNHMWNIKQTELIFHTAHN